MAGGKARLPPRWFIKTFWHVHRRIVRASRGRRGLWRPRPGKWGALRLTTTGRRSGEPRSVIIGYYEDGPNLVSMAMNGWGAAEPAWWLNLQADPQAVVELAGGVRREVLGRPAVDGERERLWQRWRELDKNLDSYAADARTRQRSSSSSRARRLNESWMRECAGLSLERSCVTKLKERREAHARARRCVAGSCALACKCFPGMEDQLEPETVRSSG